MAEQSFDWGQLSSLAGAGLGSSLLTLLFARRKTTAEANKIEADAGKVDIETSAAANKMLLDTIGELRKQLAEQLIRIDAMDKELVKLRTIHGEQLVEIIKLRGEVVRLQAALPKPPLPASPVTIGAHEAPADAGEQLSLLSVHQDEI